MEQTRLEKTLKDGSKILIREMTPADDQKVFEFFKSLPREHRLYLQFDVTNMENIERYMAMRMRYDKWRLVAEQDDKIYAEATLSSPKSGWMAHTCDIRCIIHPDFQGKGLGKAMLFELFQKALSNKVHMIKCEVAGPQVQAVKVLEKLGFQQTATRSNQVKDLTGQLHDQMIYTLNVKAMWNKLKNHFYESDLSYPS